MKIDILCKHNFQGIYKERRLSFQFLKNLKISGTFLSFSCRFFPIDHALRTSCIVELDIVSKEAV